MLSHSLWASLPLIILNLFRNCSDVWQWDKSQRNRVSKRPLKRDDMMKKGNSELYPLWQQNIHMRRGCCTCMSAVMSRTSIRDCSLFDIRGPQISQPHRWPGIKLYTQVKHLLQLGHFVICFFSGFFSNVLKT